MTDACSGHRKSEKEVQQLESLEKALLGALIDCTGVCRGEKQLYWQAE